MSKNWIDYSGLENKVYKKAYRLSDVKDRLETVAFDIVRFKDSDKAADLWQVQSADDGDYIVSMYQEEEQDKTAAAWEVLFIKTAGDLQISYKGVPLARMSSAKLGIPRSELPKAEEYLPGKLASNKKLVTALLNGLSPSFRAEILAKYPELA